jgi:hypothetical protein
MLSKLRPYLLVVLIISFLGVLIRSTGASDADIACGDTGCSGLGGAIFNEANLAPGGSVSKSVSATNNYSDARNFGVEISDANFVDSFPSMAEQLIVSIKDGPGGAILYGPKSVLQWKSDGVVILSEIGAGESKEYVFDVYFNDVGNEYQAKTLNFDLNFGFEGGEAVSGTSTTASSNSQVLGTWNLNVVGEVLGLSATGSRIVFLTFYLFGVFLIVLGEILVILRYSSRRKLM